MRLRVARRAGVGGFAGVAVAVGVGAGPAGADHRQADVGDAGARDVAEQSVVAVAIRLDCVAPQRHSRAGSEQADQERGGGLAAAVVLAEILLGRVDPDDADALAVPKREGVAVGDVVDPGGRGWRDGSA